VIRKVKVKESIEKKNKMATIRMSHPYYRRDDHAVSKYGAPILAFVITILFISFAFFGHSDGYQKERQSPIKAEAEISKMNLNDDNNHILLPIDDSNDNNDNNEEKKKKKKYSLTLPRRMHLPNFFSPQQQTTGEEQLGLGARDETNFKLTTNDLLLDDKVFDDPKNPLVGFACSYDRIPAADTRTYHVKSFTPVVTNEEATHHVTVFACNAKRMYKKFGLTTGQFYGSDQCGTWPFYGEPDSPCLEISWAYDKGAGTFTYPATFGYKVGKDTAFDMFLTQVHYLYPMNKPIKMWNDDTGAIIKLNPYRPDVVDAGVLTIMKTTMKLKPGKDETLVHYSVGQENEVYANHLKDDFIQKAEDGSLLEDSNAGVTILAVHLHAHDSAKRMKLSVESPLGDKYIVKYIDEYGGYGKDQNFFLLNNRVRVRKEDSIVVDCTFDTSKIKNDVYYGTNHNEEMCGPILMYYPKKVLGADLDQTGYFSGIHSNSVMV